LAALEPIKNLPQTYENQLTVFLGQKFVWLFFWIVLLFCSIILPLLCAMSLYILILYICP